MEQTVTEANECVYMNSLSIANNTKTISGRKNTQFIARINIKRLITHA